MIRLLIYLLIQISFCTASWALEVRIGRTCSQYFSPSPQLARAGSAEFVEQRRSSARVPLRSSKRLRSLHEIVFETDSWIVRNRINLPDNKLEQFKADVLGAIRRPHTAADLGHLFFVMTRVRFDDFTWVDADLYQAINVDAKRNGPDLNLKGLAAMLEFMVGYDGFKSELFEKWQRWTASKLSEGNLRAISKTLWYLQGAVPAAGNQFWDSIQLAVTRLIEEESTQIKGVQNDLLEASKLFLAISRLRPNILAKLPLAEIRSLALVDQDEVPLYFYFLLCSHLEHVHGIKIDEIEHYSDDRANVSPQHERLMEGLRKEGYDLKMEYPIEQAGYRADIFLPRYHTVVEVDGMKHFYIRADGTYHYRYLDLIREDILKSIGFKVLRYPTWLIERDFQGVIEDINRKLNP